MRPAARSANKSFVHPLKAAESGGRGPGLPAQRAAPLVPNAVRDGDPSGNPRRGFPLFVLKNAEKHKGETP